MAGRTSRVAGSERLWRWCRSYAALVTLVVDITQAKIRDGDPRALAALCERRGAAVLAYCEQVAARDQAADAAADAFARLRASVMALGEARSVDGDVLLLHVVRSAAGWRGSNAVAAREGRPVSESCAALEFELVAYVENSLSRAAREGVDDHLAQCRFCAAALRRLEAGERAYERPPRAPLPAGVAEELLRALVVAAPVRACGSNAAAVEREALRLLTGDRAHAVERAEPPRAAIPEAPRPDRRSLEAALRGRPEVRTGAGPALPPAGSVAPGRRTVAGPRLRLPTLDPRAAMGRRSGHATALPPAVPLAAAAVLASAVMLWTTSSAETTVAPTPSAPVVLGQPAGAGSDTP